MAFWWNITSFVKAGPMTDLAVLRVTCGHIASRATDMGKIAEIHVTGQETMISQKMVTYRNTDVTRDNRKPSVAQKAAAELKNSKDARNRRGTKHIYNEHPTPIYSLTRSPYVWSSESTGREETEGRGKWSWV